MNPIVGLFGLYIIYKKYNQDINLTGNIALFYFFPLLYIVFNAKHIIQPMLEIYRRNN